MCSPAALCARAAKYSMHSAPEITSTTRVSWMGFPVSRVSSSASVSFRARSSSAARRRMRARSAPGSAPQAGCAARAAAIAASISAGPAMGSSASFSPVAGFVVMSDSSGMGSSARLARVSGVGNVRRECITAAGGLLLAALACTSNAATEPQSCRTVRFSDIGWTDVTATTGLASHLVRMLGYEPKVTVLSVPVTFASIKNGDIDVFLGNWMPAQAADLRPYQDDRSVEVVGANLEGAKYTLAVPAYLHEAGLRDFGDIRRFAGELEHQIYGIEPGNDGNRLVLDMIKSNEHGLGDFKLVESSEQGMLAQVERAIAAKRPIVFFGWEPH